VSLLHGHKSGGGDESERVNLVSEGWVVSGMSREGEKAPPQPPETLLNPETLQDKETCCSNSHLHSSHT